MPARRQNGFQTPWSKEQVTTWVVQVLSTAAFVVTLVFFLPGLQLAAILAGYGLLLAVLIALWLHLELSDPAVATGLSHRLLRSHRTARFCVVCRKTIPGLDHHCVWLNTCVGRRNYLQFFLLSLVGTLLYLYQGVFTLLIMLGWGTVLPGVFALVALGAHVALITATFLSFVTLFGFHVYLLYLGKGTYDWLLDRRDISEPSQSPRSPPLQSRSPLSPTDDRLQRARAEWAAKHGDDVDVEYGVELTSTQRPPRPRPPHKPHDAHGDADVEAGTQRALDTPDNMGDLYVERQEREETESVSALAPASEAGSEPWQDDLSVGAEDGEGVGEAAAAPAAASGDVAGAGAAAAETEGAAAAAAAGVTAAAADAVTAENVAVADSRAGQDAEAEAGGEAEYVTVDLDTRAPDGAPSNASTNGDRAAADPAPAPESVQAEVVDSAATAGRSTESS